MKKYLVILLILTILNSCGDKQKDFANIKKGMTKEDVLKQVGEPTKKNDILIAEIWKYDLHDRTIVFRNGAVYDIMTSTEARIDSIESTLKHTGRGVKEKLRHAGDTIDSASQKIKNKIMGDSAKKN